MTRKKSKYAKCPCCFTERHWSEMSVCISILEKRERKLYQHYNLLDFDTYDSFLDSNFEWACDNCLHLKKAILAAPIKQGDCHPNLAYSDTSLVCRTCKSAFKFTKEEKQLWYEKLKFRVESSPINCLQCRKDIRLFKIENNTVSDILKKHISEIGHEDLKTVADIYRSWDKPEKAKYY